jgi:exopolyphosphatase/guanosine-5'-triphosphate,3'-diphosphate pyrophosphatase
MTCPSGWAKKYPQSAYLLQEETVAWQKTPLAFAFKEL